MQIEVVHTHAPAPVGEHWAYADIACVAASIWLLAQARAWFAARAVVRFVD